ncbi:putative dehydrogenase [Hyaloraphidium curvatum]|nr:putative dehydrogenase [Hyaloraphidium curvatum]
MPPIPELRIGFLGAGFIARFHLLSLVSVRKCRLSAVFSPSAASRDAIAAEANASDLGPCRAFSTVDELLDSGEVDAVWILGPNHARLDAVKAIVAAVGRQKAAQGSSTIFAVACEKPLARTVQEAEEMLKLVEGAGLLHGYLENQVYAPSIARGRHLIYSQPALRDPASRPYLARTAEEHSGPHNPWFWDPVQAGGGVLLDMLCHSYECARWMLTPPGKPRESLRVVKVQATTETLKWNRRPFADKLRGEMGVDYSKAGGAAPAEDYARATVTLEDVETGQPVVVECTTSWAYVGAGLRLSVEMHGPSYSMDVNTQQADLRIFLSPDAVVETAVPVGGKQAGAEPIEKANASVGLLPTIASEAFTYGYVAENQAFVEAFRNRRMPDETWSDGVDVIRVLMAMYLAAEEDRTVQEEEIIGKKLESFVPRCARPVA